MSTKRIARLVGMEVAEVNAIARDLKIATYNSTNRYWEVAVKDARGFIAHLEDLAA